MTGYYNTTYSNYTSNSTYCTTTPTSNITHYGPTDLSLHNNVVSNFPAFRVYGNRGQYVRPIPEPVVDDCELCGRESQLSDVIIEGESLELCTRCRDSVIILEERELSFFEKLVLFSEKLFRRSK